METRITNLRVELLEYTSTLLSIRYKMNYRCLLETNGIGFLDTWIAQNCVNNNIVRSGISRVYESNVGISSGYIQ